MLLLLLACAAPDLVVQVEPGDLLPTVATLRWTSGRALSSASIQVETEEGEAWTVVCSQAELAAGQATVWGLPPERSAWVQLSGQVESETLQSELLTVETGPAWSALPVLSVQGDSEGALDGQLLLTTSALSPAAAVLLDSKGRARWWAQVSDTSLASRARLSRDGRRVYGFSTDNSDDALSGLLVFDLQGHQLERIQVEGQHHDFVELPDGSLAFIVHELREVDGEAIKGDRLVERTPDGSLTQVFSAWDHFDYDPEATLLGGAEWTHANALDYLEDDDAYLLSLMGIGVIVAIDRASGEILWQVGGDDSDWTDEAGDTWVFDRSHQLQLLDDSLLVFENGSAPDLGSRAIERRLVPAEPVMQTLWSYTPDPALWSNSLGDVVRLADGDTVVDFSASGVISQVSPEGEVLWTLSAGVGGAFGYVELVKLGD